MSQDKRCSCSRCEGWDLPCSVNETSRKREELYKKLQEAAQYALDSYDWRVARDLMAIGKIDSMEQLRKVLKSLKD